MILPSKKRPAILALADGTLFRGSSIGHDGQTSGEVVFNTAMIGYQEILTDPSYTRQIVTLTYPHIGNTGVNADDVESAAIHAAGLVIKNLPLRCSSFRASATLAEFLQAQKVVAIAGIDTRKLTRLLREKGAQSGAIMTGDDAVAALALARAFPGLSGMDLAKLVSTREAYEWTEGEWALGRGYGGVPLEPATAGRTDTGSPSSGSASSCSTSSGGPSSGGSSSRSTSSCGASSSSASSGTAPFHVLAFDYGVKRNILRMLVERGCRVTVLPKATSASAALALAPDGIFLSNGPGDPAACLDAIATSRELIERGIPTFGICLGHQIMALASGAKTMKMKFGHHGANHPVQELASGKVLITSQNHGFAVDPVTLPSNCKTTHISLFDGTLQGLARTDRPAFCFQGHPEASPGPGDIAHLFDHFVNLMKEYQHGQA